MKINDKEFKKFNAEVVSFSPATLVIDNNIIEPESSYLPVIGARSYKASMRELMLDFISAEDISNFTIEIMQHSILDLDDGYIYKVWLKEEPSITEDGYKAYTVSYTLYAIKQKPLISLTDKKIKVQGNIETDYAIGIVANEDKENITINGYTVKLLKANDPFIIDGIVKKVYYASNPNASEFDNVGGLLTFPKFGPGNQSIEISDDSISFTISYYPTFM